MSHWFTVRKFSTQRFDVELSWTRDSPDLSWDETGETQEKCESGEWTCCQFRVAVYLDGREVATDHLGNSVYADPKDFAREHFGIRPKSRADGCNYGTYFTDMVHEAISEARKSVRAVQSVHIRH